MNVQAAVYLPLALAALLGAVAPRAARRLAPRRAAQSLVFVGVVAALACLSSVALLAVVGGLEFARLLGDGRGDVLPGRELIPDVAAGLAPLLLLAAVTSVLRVASRLARSHRCIQRSLADVQRSASPTAVFDDTDAYVCAIPGRPGRIVISSGLLRALNAEQQRAVFAHERAHLRHHHHRYRWLSRLVAANPLLRSLPVHLDYALERWADEEAGRHVGDRGIVAEALGITALATSQRPRLLAASTLHLGGRTASKAAGTPVSCISLGSIRYRDLARRLASS